MPRLLFPGAHILFCIIFGILVSSLSPQLFLGELGPGDLLVDRAGLHQFLVGTHPHHPPLVQNDDLVRVPDGADPLSHDQSSGILQLPVQAGTEPGIRPVVQGGEGVVEHQDLRAPRQGPCDGEPLLLAAGYVGASLGDGGMDASGHPVHKLAGLGQLQSLLNVRIGILAPAGAECITLGD